MTIKHDPPWCVESVFGNDPVDICLAYQVPEAGNPIVFASVIIGDDEDDSIEERREAVRIAALIVAAVNERESLLRVAEAAERLIERYTFAAEAEEPKALSAALAELEEKP